jgi:hypothetical protein
MAHTAETVEIDGVKVKVAIGTNEDGSAGQTRTVNVYDQSNIEGCYRAVYRLPDSSGITASEVSKHARTLDELHTYLTELGASNEGERTP